MEKTDFLVSKFMMLLEKNGQWLLQCSAKEGSCWFNKHLKLHNLKTILQLFFSALGATALGDIIYVCGGYDGVTSLNSVERYHPSTNSWCSLAPMNKSRSAGAVIACQGSLNREKNISITLFVFQVIFMLLVVMMGFQFLTLWNGIIRQPIRGRKLHLC